MTEICKELLTYSGKACDLHLHSYFSDGTCSPRELVEMASISGLSAIALTDHNSIEGVPELIEAARGSGVVPIAGIEFSTDFRGTELHLLALGLPESSFARLNDFVSEVRARKRAATDNLVENLIAAGYKIDRERISDGAHGIINRAHIAMELVRCGYVASRSEAFDDLLRSGGRFYHEPKYIDTVECVSFIEELGAVSVLAHPFLNIGEAELRELLNLTRGGLKGIETVYSEYDCVLTEKSFDLALEFGLLPSGGSDFHGKNKPDISLGRGKGNLVIPLSFAENLGLL